MADETEIVEPSEELEAIVPKGLRMLKVVLGVEPGDAPEKIANRAYAAALAAMERDRG